MNDDNFKLTKGFKGYVSKPEITDLSSEFLVRGSKNVLVDYAKRVISRKGFLRFGPPNTGGGGIKSSYEWDTSTGKQFSIRVHDGKMEFLQTSIQGVFGLWSSGVYPWLLPNPWTYNNLYTYNYNLLRSGFATSNIEFATIWDNTEKIDVLLMVDGSTNTYKWSGGISKVWKSTATTLTKQGVLTSKVTIAFVAGNFATQVAATITDADSNFINAGFASGDTLYVTGSINNSRNFTIASVAAGVLTLVMSDVLTSEAAGPSITVHNGEPTWATARFLTTGSRSITYLGVDYPYTGGESTDTLTGLVNFPTVTLGAVVWQTVVVLANPGSIPASFKQDLIGVQLNQVILASTKSREVYGSSISDYTNFTLTSPRAPGDPFKVTMDNYCTCIVPIDNLDQTTSSVMFGAGTSEFFQLSYQLSQDNANELVRMIKYKTASGSGLIARSAIASIKNSTAYISREPAFDTLDNLQKADRLAVPLSDPIKDDFDGYDFTNAHVKYWKRAVYIALPVHGIVLIYDLMRNLWQPPQTMPIGRFAIINDWLYGHSSVTDETYKLFSGTDDNGVFISQRARFAYNNGGRRDRLKNMNQYWTDGYITPNGVLNMTQNFGFDGVSGKKTMSIIGNDPTIVNPQSGSTLGDEPLGVNPLGGATLDIAGGITGMKRFWQEDTVKAPDYIESYVEYAMDTLGGQMAIVAHGNNQWDAGTTPKSHKK